MIDREKVIKCLELCRTLTDSCEGCPYENVPPVENCMLTMHDDALKLLKKQEAVVRCCDCEHWDSQCHSCEHFDGIMQPDFYCADGVKKHDR